MKKILFVDDEPNILSGLRRMLRGMREEWEMGFAESGEEALSRMEQEEPDVLVSDMRMPGMDGGTLLEVVQRDYPGVVRIILSGHSDYSMVMRAVKPAHMFLTKPCSIEELKNTVNRAIRLRAVFLDESIKDIVSSVDSLPSVPALYINLMEELKKDDPSLHTIGELISRDIGMTASILKLVNSSFFGLLRHVSSPMHAVNYLGIETIKGLVLGVKLFSGLDWAGGREFSLEGLWRHSLTTGYFARAIARTETDDGKLIDNCFIGGLLHDLGKLLLAKEFEERYLEVLAKCREENRGIRLIEKDILGTTHAEIGAYLLGLWGLSEPIVEAVFHHHEPGRSRECGFTPLVAVHAANCLEHELVVINKGYDKPGMDMDFLKSCGIDDRADKWREACVELLERSDGEDE